ncbi:MAG: CoA pyrophosphatase [Bacteroidetes bacterium]|nr:MAG: CoA pyrophosphatase [Bacteroidota bacterium]REK06676.1 MAG: CoA pyrophosphatase [Bacteroidota bacterium]REK33441.1 MAG: CoA pyrophosphatase [Bacteroidota bacterium]REK49834.1 MAG: CoA pyrophosphatase [Bacteroidota bacterium]
MAHAERKLNLARYKVPADAKWGSVMILLYEEEERVKIPLILRPDNTGIHSGQVALPGGRFEPADENLINTALRETKEEIGVDSDRIKLIGKLTELYIPPSNFLVYPHIGMLKGRPLFIPDRKEVVKVIPLDLELLMDERRVHEKEIRLSNGLGIVTPYFNVNGYTVWGATAMILSEFKSVLYEVGW